MGPIGVFGGTFDPIHYGHLRTAFELLQALELEQMRFIPCGDPPHRATPMAPAPVRLAMVRAAIEGQAGFVTDERELRRGGPSYTVDTLTSLREDFSDASLCLVIGMDAFLGLPKWHEWRDILQLAHIVVAHRPGWRAPDMGALGELLAERRTARVRDLHETRAGALYVHAVTQLEISSTEVRALIRAGRDPRFLMPDPVREYILESGCYAAKEEDTQHAK